MAQSTFDIEKVNKLYNSGKLADIKIAFDLFEKGAWTFKQIIEFVVQNHKKEIFDKSLYNMLESRTFSIGALCFEFVVEEDWEPLDIDTNYELVLYLTLKDIDGNKMISTKIKHIQMEERNIVSVLNKENTLSFVQKMDECLWKVFENVDLAKTKNLFQYISSYFINYLDKINTGEIELYNWRWKK